MRLGCGNWLNFFRFWDPRPKHPKFRNRSSPCQREAAAAAEPGEEERESFPVRVNRRNRESGEVRFKIYHRTLPRNLVTCSRQKQLEKDITTGQRRKSRGPRKLATFATVRLFVCVCEGRENETKPDTCLPACLSVCLFLLACLPGCLLFSALLRPWINEETAPPRFWPSFLPACTNCSSLEKSKRGELKF